MVLGSTSPLGVLISKRTALAALFFFFYFIKEGKIYWDHKGNIDLGGQDTLRNYTNSAPK